MQARPVSNAVRYPVVHTKNSGSSDRQTVNGHLETVRTVRFTASNFATWSSSVFQEEIAQVSSERLVNHEKRSYKDRQWLAVPYL